MNPDAAESDDIDGVSLAHFAAVSAALGEGHPLGSVLEVEGLSAATWSSAETGWKARVATDGTWFRCYQRELASAEDRLTRRVRPLDEDPAAWLGFVSAWAESPDPGAYLEAHGLRMVDVSRLQRSWGRRAEADAELRVQMAELAATGGDRGASVSVDPPTLTPSPHARATPAGSLTEAHGEASEDAPAHPELDALELHQYVALVVELQRDPAASDAILAQRGRTREDLAYLETSWRRRFAADPELARDFRHLSAHYAGQVAMARRPGVEASRSDVPWAAPPGPSVGQPARDGGPGSEAPRPEVEWAPAPPQGAPIGTNARDETGDMELPLDAVALPFEGHAVPPQAMSGEAAAEMKRWRGATVGFAQPHGTEDVDLAAAGVQIPFVVAEPRPAPAAPNVLPARLTEDVDLAALGIEIPFVATAPRPPKAVDELPLASSSDGETADLDLSDLLAATPFEASSIAMDHHAQLCAELTHAPSHATAILARHRMSYDDWQRHDAYWRRQLHQRPDVYVSWRRSYDAHAALLSHRTEGR